jgi:NADPH2:quinone reductase
MKPRGKIVAYGSALSLKPEIPFYDFLFKGISIDFMLLYLLGETERRSAVNLIDAAMAMNKLDIPIHRVFPLKECSIAHQVVEQGNRNGAVLVSPIM